MQKQNLLKSSLLISVMASECLRGVGFIKRILLVWLSISETDFLKGLAENFSGYFLNKPKLFCCAFSMLFYKQG